MSRRRRQRQPDSLELLLDTMCNTFGGIIMIALLIALLSRDASSETAATERAEHLRRQIQSIEQQTSEAEQLRRRLVQSADPETAATLELLTRRDQLRRKAESSRATVQSNATALASLPVVDPAEIERLQNELQSRTNQFKTLQQQIERDTQARQRALRLPRERVTGKKTYYFIVRFGKIYPVHIMREGRRELNTQTIQWTRSAESETATPRRELGFDPATGLQAFARVFNEIPPQTYSIHFLVYDDSIPTFLNARQIPLGRNFDTGWEFLPQERPVVFSSSGDAPPAL